MGNKPICDIDEHGTKRWYLNGGILHREDGPAIEYTGSTKIWKLNGVYHRKYGPAMEYTDGYKEWRYHHKRHRLDGPAVTWGDEHKEWWIRGHPITYQLVQWAKENEIDLENLTEEDITIIKLVWADYGN